MTRADTPAIDEYKRKRHNHTAAASTTLNHTRHTLLTIVSPCIARAHVAFAALRSGQSGRAQNLATLACSGKTQAEPRQLQQPPSVQGETAASTCARTHRTSVLYSNGTGVQTTQHACVSQRTHLLAAPGQTSRLLREQKSTPNLTKHVAVSCARHNTRACEQGMQSAGALARR